MHRSQQVATQCKHQVEILPKQTTTEQQVNHKHRPDNGTIYPDVFEVIGKLQGPPYTIHLDPSITPKQIPWQPVPIHLKESFKKEIDKVLQAGVLNPVTETTPWINSFVSVESKDKSGNLKLHIYLDPQT